jgi:hypothetical protein
MGVTAFDIQILENIIKWHGVKSVIELGAQNNYSQPNLPAPYMREWYEAKGIAYDSIDLSGECGAIAMDLGKPFQNPLGSWNFPYLAFGYDLVADFGTSEHVSDDGNSYGTGKFSWEAIYNCWETKNLLLRDSGGIMFSENPKTGNWPGHGFNYYCLDFYIQLCEKSDYRIIELGEHAAMNNYVDGYNIYCIMQKTGPGFISFADFQKLPLYKS